MQRGVRATNKFHGGHYGQLALTRAGSLIWFVFRACDGLGGKLVRRLFLLWLGEQPAEGAARADV